MTSCLLMKASSNRTRGNSLRDIFPLGTCALQLWCVSGGTKYARHIFGETLRRTLECKMTRSMVWISEAGIVLISLMRSSCTDSV